MTLDLDGLERVASAATPGPWRVRTNRHTTTSGEEWGWVSHVTTQNISLPGMSINWEAPTGRANATHIAVFNPVTVLALLARARDAERLKRVAIDVMASLGAAISLLERSPKTAAPSNKMFNVMLDDYRASLKSARQALSTLNEGDE